MDNYLNAKLRIFDGAQNVVLFGDDDVLLQKCQQYMTAQTPNRSIDNTRIVISSEPTYHQYGLIDTSKTPNHFTLQEKKKNTGTYLAFGGADGVLFLLHTNDLKIKGVHNFTNALFALAIGELLNIPAQTMFDTLKDFAGLPHRCQYVATVDGMDYFNDSKGTNIGSTQAAMAGFGQVYGKHSLILILGGVGKGQDFSELAPLVLQYASAVLTIGQDGDLIGNTLKAQGVSTPIIACHTLEKAVETANTCQGKAVLLSPACASLDQFKNYNERGDTFMALVQALIN